MAHSADDDVMSVGASLAVVLSTALAVVGSTTDAAVGPRATEGSPVAESQPARVSASWTWPVDDPHEVLRGFTRPEQRWLPGHRGVDLAAGVGQVVRAPETGTVSWAGLLAGRGVVVVTHPGGLRSTFEPVARALPVGTVVQRGDLVASVSDAPGHCAPATCLHWGVLRGRTYLDPLSLLGREPVVLLPLS